MVDIREQKPDKILLLKNAGAAVSVACPSGRTVRPIAIEVPMSLLVPQTVVVVKKLEGCIQMLGKLGRELA